ncbi:MAG TPA: hypothetical protein VEH04_03875 [Verrucomicrobiae bacterium]|nr:hypothetical protein [Verrucomicrobiae bacterium]
MIGYHKEGIARDVIRQERVKEDLITVISRRALPHLVRAWQSPDQETGTQAQLGQMHLSLFLLLASTAGFSASAAANVVPAAVHIMTPLAQEAGKACRAKQKQGRRFRALRAFGEDVELLKAVNRICDQRLSQL